MYGTPLLFERNILLPLLNYNICCEVSYQLFEYLPVVQLDIKVARVQGSVMNDSCGFWLRRLGGHVVFLSRIFFLLAQSPRRQRVVERGAAFIVDATIAPMGELIKFVFFFILIFCSSTTEH